MKTSLLITIEHPADTSADWLISDAIKSVLNDINSDLEEGWEIHSKEVTVTTYGTKEPITQ